jgi:hypothetical protein
MGRFVVVRRDDLRRAATGLPSPHHHEGDHFEVQVGGSGKDSVRLRFARKNTVSDDPLWCFEGLLNVETLEDSGPKRKEKRYQKPKAEKNSLAAWIRGEMGARCESVRVGKYDAESEGLEVSIYFR